MSMQMFRLFECIVNLFPPGDTPALKCSNVVVPLCQGLGYDKTFVPEAKQREKVKWMETVIGNYTADGRCGEMRRQFVCTDYIQPCKDSKLQRLCRHKCNKFFDTCNFTMYGILTKSICMEFPEGDMTTDLCWETNWPKYENWPKPLATTKG